MMLQKSKLKGSYIPGVSRIEIIVMLVWPHDEVPVDLKHRKTM